MKRSHKQERRKVEMETKYGNREVVGGKEAY